VPDRRAKLIVAKVRRGSIAVKRERQTRRVGLEPTTTLFSGGSAEPLERRVLYQLS
jgi:hypothetical protein